jgi:hypothetical protein
MAPPLALSWQQIWLGEQHWLGPDGHGWDTVFGSLHVGGGGIGQQPSGVSHSCWPGGQPQSWPSAVHGAPDLQQKPPHWVGWSGGQMQWSTSQRTRGSQHVAPHCRSLSMHVVVHVPSLHVCPAVQHWLPHIAPGVPVPPSGAAPPEGQPHAPPLHVPVDGVQHITPPEPHGSHVSFGQQVEPQRMPRVAGQHAPAGSAPLLTHVGSLDGQPPPAHAVVSPGGVVAPWPTVQPVALHAEHAMPGGAQ